MADTKISDATAVTVVSGAIEIPCNDAGNSKKITLLQVHTPPTAVVTPAGTDAFPVVQAGALKNATLTQIGTFAASQKLRPPAGSAAAASAPLCFASGTLMTTPENGSVEYDGILPYFTPFGAARAIMVTRFFHAVQGDFTLAAASGVQTCLPAAGDILTLQATTTYEFEGQYIMNTGNTTHTTAMAFALAGGATVTSVEYVTDAHSAAANTIAAAQTCHVSGVASKVITATSTAVWTIIRFKGIWRHNAAGTVTPQIAFSANPTGTNLMKVGSYIRFIPIGTNTVQTVGPWA